MVSVTVTLYGDAAKQLEAALDKYNGSVTLPMTAPFTIHNVEGRPKVYAEFTGEASKTPEQKRMDAQELDAEAAKLREELKSFMEP